MTKSIETIGQRQYYRITDLEAVGFASRTKIWRLIRDGELPAVRVGRSVRIPADGFAFYCETHQVVDPIEKYLVKQEQAQAVV